MGAVAALASLYQLKATPTTSATTAQISISNKTRFRLRLPLMPGSLPGWLGQVASSAAVFTINWVMLSVALVHVDHVGVINAEATDSDGRCGATQARCRAAAPQRAVAPERAAARCAPRTRWRRSAR